MFEVKKQVTIDLSIDIDQEGLEELIKAEIFRQDQTIVVDSIKFIQRRSPSALEVSVEAHMEGHDSISPETVTPSVFDAPKPLEEVEETPEVEEADSKVEDLSEAVAKEIEAMTSVKPKPVAVEPKKKEESAPKRTLSSLFDS